MKRFEWPAVVSVVCLLAGCVTPSSVDAGIDGGPIIIQPIVDSGVSRCLDISSPPAGPCGCLDDCVTGSQCQTETSTGFPAGFCAAPCDGGQGCFGGAIVDPCTTNTTCRDGYVCAVNPLSGEGACVAGCVFDSQCPETSHCDRYTGKCQAEPAGLGVGVRCVRDEECKSNTCLIAPGHPGFCASACDLRTPFCPENAICLPIGADGDTDGLCYRGCDASGPCRSGEVCSASGLCLVTGDADAGCFGLGSGPQGSCNCAADCEPTYTCNTETAKGVPGGRCLHSCDPARSLPSGEVCVNAIIYLACDASRPCREGFACSVQSSTGLARCTAQCDADSQCPTVGHCNRYSGTCAPEPTTGSGVMGACSTNADCKSGFCGTLSGHAVCLSLCNTTTGLCPDATTCIVLSSDPRDQVGLCGTSCDGARPCPGGKVCSGGLCF